MPRQSELHVRLGGLELEELKELAEFRGCSMAEAVRLAVHEAVMRERHSGLQFASRQARGL